MAAEAKRATCLREQGSIADATSPSKARTWDMANYAIEVQGELYRIKALAFAAEEAGDQMPAIKDHVAVKYLNHIQHFITLISRCADVAMGHADTIERAGYDVPAGSGA